MGINDVALLDLRSSGAGLQIFDRFFLKVLLQHELLFENSVFQKVSDILKGSG